MLLVNLTVGVSTVRAGRVVVSVAEGAILYEGRAITYCQESFKELRLLKLFIWIHIKSRTALRLLQVVDLIDPTTPLQNP